MTARLFAAVVKDAFFTADDYLPRWPFAVLGAIAAPAAALLIRRFARAVDDNLADFGGDS